MQPELVSVLHSPFNIHSPNPQFASSGKHLPVLLNIDSAWLGAQPHRGGPGAGRQGSFQSSSILPLHALAHMQQAQS